MAQRAVMLLALAFCFASGEPPAFGQEDPAASQLFNVASKAFDAGFYEKAEKDFAEFAAKYPQSTKRSEAILRQAQSRFYLKQYGPALELLKAHAPSAGALAEQYQFWFAEALFFGQRYSEAAAAYASFLANHPGSPLRLEASYGQAFAHFKLQQFGRTTELLSKPDGAFLSAARQSANHAVVAEGYLLLAEAFFAEKNYRAAEEVLIELGKRPLSPDAEWRRQHLLATTELADKRAEDALKRAANLIELARQLPDKPVYLANSLTLQAEILRQNDPDAAIQAYEKITKISGISTNQTRQAWFTIVDLTISRNQLTNAVERLSSYLNQNAQDPAVDLLRVTLGELQLKQFYALTHAPGPSGSQTNLAVATNLLQQARAQFDTVISSMTNSPLLGKAYLDRGWCLWEEGRLTGSPAKILESEESFRVAAERLPESEDQAIARFKLADCQFERKDFTNAITNYRLLLDTYSNVAPVKNRFFDQALYQTIQASAALRDLGAAKEALDKALQWFPTNALTERCLLAYGQALLRHGLAADARNALEQFPQRFPQSPLLPDMELVIASTYAYETNWPAAVGEYEKWLSRHTNHVARPQAEFDRAWAYYQSGNETNALHLFTNFVARFPSTTLAPLAQYWVGDYYLRRGDHRRAELSYQELQINTNFVRTDLTFQAQLMSARSALLRRPSEARGYLNVLLDDRSPCPPVFKAEAFFLLGEVIIAEGPTPSVTNVFAEAIKAYGRITNYYSTTWLEPLARGKIANCLLQLAVQDTNYYAHAFNEYKQIVEASPLADVATRSQAECGMALVLEKQAELKPSERDTLLQQALDRYLNVALEGNVRRERREKPDVFWVRKAAWEAGRLSERLQKYDQAIKLYERLANHLPALKPEFDEKIALLRKRDAKP